MPHRAIHARFVDTARALSPALSDAIAALGPVELTSRADLPFADYLCRAIAGQQLSVKAAKTIWGRVEDSAGDVPLIEHLCDANTDLLRSCGLSRAKTKTVCAIAALARQGELKDDQLRAMSAAERTARITAIWGVGQWTADMMNMFWFGEPDIWPEGDVAARKTLQRLTSARRKTVRTAARFAPQRSYLALYMWRHVDAKPA
ncbi:MAG: DNA-3-methyladenine glycosylase 2 family protein [Rhodobacterales bacterium CG15_BIG_FIL_POST_REV_8_21_14_020_59_13]|nr:MAG: DNA-3-methyladenine glycosylase 2 family protein [Rhodobacterales bacterium CG15_BIG_FIL_POST_REV_8_21_14_020_59_13]